MLKYFEKEGEEEENKGKERQQSLFTDNVLLALTTEISVLDEYKNNRICT
jgi:hypothetical protein